MTEPTDLSSLSAAPYVGGHAGPGRSIRMAREAAGLSLEELATQMRLARATLDALERDDFSTLSEPVYIRGYYRKCAKALNLSEADLLAGYERLAAPKAPPPPTKLLLANANARADGDRRSGLRWIAAVLLAVLIGAVLFLSSRSDLVKAPEQPAGAPAETPAAASEPAPEPLPTAPAAESLPPAPPASVSSTAATSPEPLATAPAAVEAPKPTPTEPVGTPAQPVVAPPPPAAPVAAVAPTVEAPAAAAAKPAAVGELKLHFRGTSWVRVQDATGKTLLSGVIETGEQQTLNGLPPYSVFLGNAPSVDVEFAGQPLKLDSYVKGNSTARFTVPAAP